MTARREALTLIIGALMLVVAAVTVTEAHERASQPPTVSVGEHSDGAAVVLPGN
ncbi:hypothetical protein [Mycolicibacterium brisbanense]